LFVTPRASKEQQENDFIQGVDSLMSFTMFNLPLNEAVINYLIDGFKVYGLERVITHIAENYVLDKSCISDEEESELRFRVEGFRKMAVGNTAPDIVIKEANGRRFRLSEQEYDRYVLFFWASWCPHCSQVIPDLIALHESYGENTLFVSISVDKDRSAWERASLKEEIPWKNMAELQGWSGQTVKDYYIYATPTLFVLDGDLKILGKPISKEEIEKLLKL
jgi:thiol-disulfide isomerase/thioredoxin